MSAAADLSPYTPSNANQGSRVQNRMLEYRVMRKNGVVNGGPLCFARRFLVDVSLQNYGLESPLAMFRNVSNLFCASQC